MPAVTEIVIHYLNALTKIVLVLDFHLILLIGISHIFKKSVINSAAPNNRTVIL